MAKHCFHLVVELMASINRDILLNNGNIYAGIM